MKRMSMLLALVAGLMCLVLLVACTGNPAAPQDTTADTTADTSLEVGTDTDTGLTETTDETTAPADTATDGTGAAETKREPEETTEAVTRYDYFEAEVLPDVAIEKKDYEGLTLKLDPALLITDENVQDYIVYLRYQERKADNGTTQVKDKPLKLGDSAFIYYEGKIDGVAFEGGSNMEEKAPYELGLGSGRFVPGFEEGLIGVVPNTTSKDKPFVLTVTFPEDYGNEELNGKEAVFYVVVEYAVQYTMPDYTRDFVENTLKFEPEKEHVTDGSYLAEFEAYLKEYLESKNASYVDSAKTDALWTYLTDLVECKHMPESEIAYYRDSYKNEIQSAYDYYASSGGEEFKKLYDTVGKFAVAYMGFPKDSDWEEEIEKMSRLMVEKDMIIHAIAELEGIETVTKEELDEEIEYWVEYYSGYMTKEDILENIGEAYLKESAFAVKMYEFLIGKVNFVYEADTEATA